MVSPGENITDGASQTDADMFSGSCSPDCEARFEVKLRDFRARIERELNDQMQVAMRKLEERVCAAAYSCVILVCLAFNVIRSLLVMVCIAFFFGFTESLCSSTLPDIFSYYC